jgi:hypothetical protein
MSQFSQLLSLLQEQMHATISRSDVLRPLAWLLIILSSTTLIALYLQLPVWFSAPAAILWFAAVILYGYAFLFSLRAAPDMLRSEKFSLQKMAIERGVFGDSAAGILEVTSTKGTLIVGSDASKEEKPE